MRMFDNEGDIQDLFTTDLPGLSDEKQNSILVVYSCMKKGLLCSLHK